MNHANTSGMTLVGGATGWKAQDVRNLRLHFIEPAEETRLRKLNPEKVKLLASSIVEHGQKQPIGVKEIETGDGFNRKYRLIWGLHRYAALRLLEENGTYQEASAQVIVYGKDYPDIACQADEIIENLHRNDLTPAEQAVHSEKYAAILKELKKVRSAHERRIEKMKGNKNNSTKDRAKVSEVQTHLTDSGNGHASTEINKPTIREKLQQDLGTDRATVTRRHNQAVELAKREGYDGETSLEKMSAEDHHKVADLASVAATKKKEKAVETGKSERVTDSIRSGRTSIEVKIEHLPVDLIRWCRNRMTDGRLTLEQVKEAHTALGEYIRELEA